MKFIFYLRMFSLPLIACYPCYDNNNINNIDVNTIQTISNNSNDDVKEISWNWFYNKSNDCFPDFTVDDYNDGYYAGSINIPQDCGKSVTFENVTLPNGTYIENSNVTVIFAWMVGKNNYYELTPNAFSQLIGSHSKKVKGEKLEDFKYKINDPGYVTGYCTETF